MASERAPAPQQAKFLNSEGKRGDLSLQQKLGEAEMACLTHTRAMDPLHFQYPLEGFQMQREIIGGNKHAAGDGVNVVIDVQGSIDDKGPFENEESESAQQGKGLFKHMAGKLLQSVKTLFSGLTGFKLRRNAVVHGRLKADV